MVVDAPADEPLQVMPGGCSRWAWRRRSLWTVWLVLRLRNARTATLDCMIELPDIFAAALALLTFAVFAALVWAGNHQH